MATGKHMDERSVDCLVLGHHDQDRKVSAKSVTMRGTTFYRRKVHTTRTFFTPTTHEIRGMRVV